MVHVGCSGWAAARGRYFQELRATEVQQTFYQPPRPATLARWRDEAPEGFRFALKAFQLVTHRASSPTYRRLRRPLQDPGAVGAFQDTPQVRGAWEETVEAATALRAHVVLLQLPGSFTPEPGNLARIRAFAGWARRGPFRIAFEPRGKAWEPEQADALCQELGFLRACDPFAVPPPDPGLQPTAYFRLHGIGGYRYRFRDEDLARLREALQGYREAWVFFNNVSMWEDALRFRDRL